MFPLTRKMVTMGVTDGVNCRTASGMHILVCHMTSVMRRCRFVLKNTWYETSAKLLCA